MRFTHHLTTLLLPSLLLAAPTPRAIDPCAPTLYTLSAFTLTTSPTAASVAFTFESTFATPLNISDAVTSGATCSAKGDSLPNNNVCDVADRKLLFDLRAPQTEGRYQITHTWVCDGKTYMSGNDVTVSDVVCETAGDMRTCVKEGTQEIAPQNVRRICNTPRCSGVEALFGVMTLGTERTDS